MGEGVLYDRFLYPDIRFLHRRCRIPCRKASNIDGETLINQSHLVRMWLLLDMALIEWTESMKPSHFEFSYTTALLCPKVLGIRAGPSTYSLKVERPWHCPGVPLTMNQNRVSGMESLLYMDCRGFSYNIMLEMQG